MPYKIFQEIDLEAEKALAAKLWKAKEEQELKFKHLFLFQALLHSPQIDFLTRT